MLTQRIRFELAMKRGASLKEIKLEFPEWKPAIIRDRIYQLGYRREYVTNEEWQHLLKRRTAGNL